MRYEKTQNPLRLDQIVELDPKKFKGKIQSSVGPINWKVFNEKK